MVTPFDEGGALDLDSAANLAAWLVDNGSGAKLPREFYSGKVDITEALGEVTLLYFTPQGEAQPVKVEPDKPVEKDLLGMKLGMLTDELRGQMNLPEDSQGLIVTDVDQTTEAYEKGLRAGDLITEAGQQRVTSIEDFESRIAEAKDAGRKSILLLIRREGDPRFVALSVE